MIITNDRGRRFRVALVRVGERYGRNDCLVHDGGRVGGPLVEFYDLEHANQGPDGQFVSRYYASTLLDDARPGRGLCLDGGVSAWNLDAEAMRLVIAWIRREVAP